MNLYEVEVMVRQTVQVQAESHEAAAASVRDQSRSGEVTVMRTFHIGMAARTGLLPLGVNRALIGDDMPTTASECTPQGVTQAMPIEFIGDIA